MIFFVGNDGTVIKTLPSPVYQGSSNANTIYLVAPFASGLSVTVAFQLPNGVWTPPSLMRNGLAGKDEMTAQGALDGGNGTIVEKETGKVYAVWSYALPNDITRYYGTVTAQFFFYAAQNGVVTASSSAVFTVGRGVPADISGIEAPDVYEDILNNLSAFRTDLDNGAYPARGFKSWNAVYVYGAKEYVFYPSVGEFGAILISLKENNAEPPYLDGDVNKNAWDLVADFNNLLVGPQGPPGSPGESVTASDTLPLMDGVQSAGTENAYARGDHRHPSDTTKADKTELSTKADISDLSTAFTVTIPSSRWSSNRAILTSSDNALIGRLTANSNIEFIPSDASAANAIKYNVVASAVSTGAITFTRSGSFTASISGTIVVISF